MKKNVKIMLRLILCIALAMTMLGCVGISFPMFGLTVGISDDLSNNRKTTAYDLVGTWKTSNTTTENGKTVTVDNYMKFAFNSFMETSVIKITQGNQPVEMVFFPEDTQFISSYLYVAHKPLSLTLKMRSSPSRIITFYDGTKKNLYVDDNSDTEYTKFDGEIPKKGF